MSGVIFGRVDMRFDYQCEKCNYHTVSSSPDLEFCPIPWADGVCGGDLWGPTVEWSEVSAEIDRLRSLVVRLGGTPSLATACRRSSDERRDLRRKDYNMTTKGWYFLLPLVAYIVLALYLGRAW